MAATSQTTPADVKKNSQLESQNDKGVNLKEIVGDDLAKGFGKPDGVQLVKIESAGTWKGVDNLTMLSFDVNGKIERHGISDSALLEIIKERESKCFKPCSPQQTSLSVPSFSLSGQESHNVHPTHLNRDG